MNDPWTDFACAALTGLLAQEGANYQGFGSVANDAAKYADAMVRALDERRKTQQAIDAAEAEKRIAAYGAPLAPGPTTPGAWLDRGGLWHHGMPPAAATGPLPPTRTLSPGEQQEAYVEAVRATGLKPTPEPIDDTFEPRVTLPPEAKPCERFDMSGQ